MCDRSQSLAECQRELMLVKAECLRLEEKVSQGQSVERELRDEMEKIRAELEDYKAESLSWRQIERDMEEVYARLEDVDELKRGYERKIARLRLRLRDSGEASACDEDENSELIDMRRDAQSGGASVMTSGEKRVSSTRDENSDMEEDDSDWLRTLPREI